jgi:hypothetical protein
MSGINEITYEGAVSVAASDATNDPHGPFAAFYVGTTGTVVVQTLRNQTATFKNVPQGTIVRVAILRVWSTGTVGNGADVLGLTQLPYKGK